MRFGLIGGTLEHSWSPVIHEQLFSLAGAADLHTYTAVPLGAEAADTALCRLERAGFVGLNVTIPYKTAVMPYIPHIAPAARHIGAVNTIYFTPQGRYGYNTDYGGFGRALTAAHWETARKNCTVLGTGGAARAVVQYLRDHGADVTVLSRYPEKQRAFAAFCKRCGATLTDYSSSRGGDMLINCTPVGMFPRTEEMPAVPQLDGYAAVADLIYNPYETRLLRQVRIQGSRTLNGMYMLIAQATEAEEIWQQRTFPPAWTERIAAFMEKKYGGR